MWAETYLLEMARLLLSRIGKNEGVCDAIDRVFGKASIQTRLKLLEILERKAT